MKADTASMYRAAAALALGFAVASIVSFAGMFALDVRRGPAPTFSMDEAPNPAWDAPWLPGAITPAEQQQAVIEQWLNLLVVFGAIAVAVGCINALIGFLSHANERRYETALRAIVGASRKQLRLALLKNAVFNALLGVAVGVPLGIGFARSFVRLWRSGAGIDLDWIIVACAASLAIAAFGAYFAAGRMKRTGWMGDALAPEARTLPGFGAEDLRALLTAAQLACAVALTTVSLLVWSYASATPAEPRDMRDRYVTRIDLGERTTPLQRRAAYETIRAKLRATNGIEAESIASAGALLGTGTIDKVVSECGRCYRANMYTPFFPLETQQHVTGPGFFDSAGIQLTRGRDFSGDGRDVGKIIVNALFAREAFAGQNAIGKRVHAGAFGKGGWYTVIGVVEEVVAYPAIYFSTTEHAPSQIDVVIVARQEAALQAGFGFQALSLFVQNAHAPQRRFSRVLTMLGMLLGGAAILGSFIATMLSVRSGRSEIAIRRAVGARRADVWRWVYQRVGRITARGISAGLVLSVALSRAIEVFIPGLPLFDALTAAFVALAFFVIAFLAALLPLRDALLIAPSAVHE